MSKYAKLTDYLSDPARMEHEDLTIGFSRIEKILGFPLPESARRHQAWWANQMRGQSLAWQEAGWKTVNLDLRAEKVEFVYAGKNHIHFEFENSEDVAPLTIDQAKEGLAKQFGVDTSQIVITISG